MPVYDVGTVGDGIFVVMPYLSGGTLSSWLRARARSWREVLDRFVAAGRGLAVAHAAGLVHRDFKPDNVLLDEHGELAVADFGLAIDADVGSSGIAGTPAYMAPEQLRGDAVDERADIFGFCASLYEGLYGERAFDAPSGYDDAARAALLDAIRARKLRPPPRDRDVPAWLRAAIVRGLAPEPRDRWPTIDALLAHVGARRRRPRRVAIAIAAVAAVAVLAGALVIASRDRAAPRVYREHRLTALGGVTAAALAPDGDRVAFTAGGTLYTLDLADGGAPRALATGARVDGNFVSWSAEGDAISYSRSVGDDLVLAIVDAGTGADRAIVADHSRDALARGGLAVHWYLSQKQLAIGPPAHPGRACAVPGTYDWLWDAIPSGDDLFVDVVDARRSAHRLLRTDLRCSSWTTIVESARLSSIAAGRGGGLVAIADGEVIAIDRDGAIAPLGVAAHGPDAAIAGVRANGAVVLADGESTWQLVRVSRDGRTTELTGGALAAQIAVDPTERSLAIVDQGADGGPLRVVPLADPRQRAAPIDRGVLAVDWSPDGASLGVIVRRGDATVLAVEDRAGRHRFERPITDGSESPVVTWIDDRTLAYLAAGNRTYRAIDVATGTARDLFDPAIGFTLELSRAPRSGDLLLYWNRRSGPGLWRMTPDGRTSLVYRTDGAMPRWAADEAGVLVWTPRSDSIQRVDVATGAVTPYVTIPSSEHTVMGAVWALANGDLLVERTRSVYDVIVQEPVR
jgi:hypothetical protein